MSYYDTNLLIDELVDKKLFKKLIISSSIQSYAKRKSYDFY